MITDVCLYLFSKSWGSFLWIFRIHKFILSGIIGTYLSLGRNLYCEQIWLDAASVKPFLQQIYVIYHCEFLCRLSWTNLCHCEHGRRSLKQITWITLKNNAPSVFATSVLSLCKHLRNFASQSQCDRTNGELLHIPWIHCWGDIVNGQWSYSRQQASSRTWGPKSS